MKTFYSKGAFLILMVIFGSVQAQILNNKNVPQKTINAFMNKFPGAEKVKWEIEKENYEAEFRLNNTALAAIFDSLGNWIQTEKEIPLSEVPSDVINTINLSYSDFKVHETNDIQSALRGHCYMAELENGHEMLEVYISPSGDILSQISEMKSSHKK